MKYLALFLITVAFTIGTVLSPIVMLLTLPWRGDIVFRAMNRLCGAAYFGFDGSKTISKTCGLRLQSSPDSEPCCSLCAALELLEDKHCTKEAAS